MFGARQATASIAIDAGHDTASQREVLSASWRGLWPRADEPPRRRRGAAKGKRAASAVMLWRDIAGVDALEGHRLVVLHAACAAPPSAAPRPGAKTIVLRSSPLGVVISPKPGRLTKSSRISDGESHVATTRRGASLDPSA
jgi:hypothetical protein